MKWHATPEGQRVKARRWTGSGWSPLCDYSDLRPGEIFQAVDPEDGIVFHVGTGESDDKTVMLVTDYPIKNPPTGENGQHYGYAVPIETFESLDVLKAKGIC